MIGWGCDIFRQGYHTMKTSKHITHNLYTPGYESSLPSACHAAASELYGCRQVTQGNPQS